MLFWSLYGTENHVEFLLGTNRTLCCVNFTEGRSLVDTSVIPKDIDASSVQIQGEWDNFNITWDPIRSVNYGKLQYYLLLNSEIEKEAFVSRTASSFFLF